MQLHDTTVVWRMPAILDNEYAFGVPKHFCDILFPGIGKKLSGVNKESSPIPTFARMALFNDGIDDEASKYRIVVFPYKAPNEFSHLYRVRGRMKNRPGAMFVVSWILEDLSCFNFLSSTGIDAHDGRGLVDALLAFDTQRSAVFLRGSYSNPDMIAKFVYHLNHALLGRPLRGSNPHKTQAKKLSDPGQLSDPLKLRAAIECAKYAIDANRSRSSPTCPEIAKAANKWEVFWKVFINTQAQKQTHPVEFMPFFGASSLSAAPYFVERVQEIEVLYDDEPFLRIENAFSPTEIVAFDHFHDDGVSKAEFCSADDIPMTRSYALNSIIQSSYFLKLTIAPNEVENLKHVLPSHTDRPTFATVGLDAISRTLSIHLKPHSEVARQFSLTFSSADRTSSISDFALQLFSKEFNLRSLFDRHEDGYNGSYKHTVEFTAAVDKSPIGLQYLGDAIAAAMLRKTNYFSHSVGILPDLEIKVSQPYRVSGVKDCLEVMCACVSEEKFCNKARCDACRDLRLKVFEKGKGVFQDRINDRIVMTVSDGRWRASACLAGAGTDSAIPFEDFKKSWNPCAPFSALMANGLGFLVDHATEYSTESVSALRTAVAEAIVKGWNPAPTIQAKQEEIPDHEIGSEGILERIHGEPRLKMQFTYDLLKKAGQNGEVYIITLTRLETEKESEFFVNRSYALKILPKTLESYYKEAPPNLPVNISPQSLRVWVKDGAGNLEGTGVLMELLDGYDFEDCVRCHSHHYLLKDTAEWLLQTSKHLVTFNKSGYVHWDIKPGNVWLKDNGHVMLIDFGLVGGGTGSENTCEQNYCKPYNLNKRGKWSVFGSKYHIAPEILATKNKKTSHKTTVFGLGSLACHLLGDKAAMSIKKKILPQVPVYVRYILNDSDFDILHRSILKDPQRRPNLDELVGCFQRMVSTLSL